VETYAFDKNQFYGKNLIFGDFMINDKDVFNQDILSKIRISDKYTPENLMFITPILDKETNIDDIYITLPCGMRNSTDTIEYLQSICSNQAYKSNYINVFIKNIDLEEDDEEKLNSRIISEIAKQSPLTTEINNIIIT
jgi:hypothetical protein